MKLRRAVLDDVPEIQAMSERYHQTRLDTTQCEMDGFTSAIYKQKVLENIVDDGMSVVVDGLVGYYLLCGKDAFARAFGYSLEDAMKEYGVSVEGSAAYGPQTCMEQSARGKKLFTAMDHWITERARERGVRQVYVETRKENTATVVKLAKRGWEFVAEKTDESLYVFKGNDGELIDRPEIADQPVVWCLFRKELKKKGMEKLGTVYF